MEKPSTLGKTESIAEEMMRNYGMDEVRYEDSGIDARILRGIKEMGFEVMTPIQAQAIPRLLEGKDIIGQAQTGTGKTAAFGIPLIQKVNPEKKHLQAIVLCPTRELAIQAAEELRKLAKFMHGIKVLPIYGGQDINTQIRSLKNGVQIVVGTPGRVMDHMRRHTMKLDHIDTMVLDEADEMLNMGFREDIETILEGMSTEHQTALFSATMPKPILDITKKYQKDAVMVKIAAKELTIPLVKQYYYEVHGKSKIDVTCRLLDYYHPKRTMIFCNTKKMVDELAENLKGRGYFAEGLHGDLSQRQRDLVMSRFRNANSDILIATDVAARGIDVDDIEAVVNFDVPQDIEYYVHRIGRTGRAGKKGRSFTLVVGREIYKIREIERACKTKLKCRRIPTVSDVTEMKAQKCLSDAITVMQEKDISSVMKFIEQKINDDDITAMELAAAFLKLNMGDEVKEIEEVWFGNRERDRRFERKDRFGRGYDKKGRNGRAKDTKTGFEKYMDSGKEKNKKFAKERKVDKIFGKGKDHGKKWDETPKREDSKKRDGHKNKKKKSNNR